MESPESIKKYLPRRNPVSEAPSPNLGASPTTMDDMSMFVKSKAKASMESFENENAYDLTPSAPAAKPPQSKVKHEVNNNSSPLSERNYNYIHSQQSQWRPQLSPFNKDEHYRSLSNSPSKNYKDRMNNLRSSKTSPAKVRLKSSSVDQDRYLTLQTELGNLKQECAKRKKDFEKMQSNYEDKLQVCEHELQQERKQVSKLRGELSRKSLQADDLESEKESLGLQNEKLKLEKTALRESKEKLEKSNRKLEENRLELVAKLIQYVERLEYCKKNHSSRIKVPAKKGNKTKDVVVSKLEKEVPIAEEKEVPIAEKNEEVVASPPTSSSSSPKSPSSASLFQKQSLSKLMNLMQLESPKLDDDFKNLIKMLLENLNLYLRKNTGQVEVVEYKHESGQKDNAENQSREESTKNGDIELQEYVKEKQETNKSKKSVSASTQTTSTSPKIQVVVSFSGQEAHHTPHNFESDNTNAKEDERVSEKCIGSASMKVKGLTPQIVCETLLQPNLLNQQQHVGANQNVDSKDPNKSRKDTDFGEEESCTPKASHFTKKQDFSSQTTAHGGPYFENSSIIESKNKLERFPTQSFTYQTTRTSSQKEPKSLQKEPKSLQKEPKSLQKESKSLQKESKSLQKESKSLQKESLRNQEEVYYLGTKGCCDKETNVRTNSTIASGILETGHVKKNEGGSDKGRFVFEEKADVKFFPINDDHEDLIPKKCTVCFEKEENTDSNFGIHYLPQFS
ncbi:hypothetical protein KGF56_002826 [Candida oxycetoniae]|uniref:Uncharacterized protein n=1 Tax=Candida oxycetoniae TaxID=497107 RepID=A0AAI9SX76_9ASCO|nr:uncharacterized protein KGF56_002826 [Candida oxycetoniae]KAI3404429.2 hypothetical protein KGF56_002826 [Candida oxycetoniae]